MPRLVRQQTASQRLKAKFNIQDWWLWLSEEIETRDLDEQFGGTPIGLALNFIFLIAQANAGSLSSSNDLFDTGSNSGWASWLASLVVWSLTLLSLTITFFTTTHNRKYRLHGANVEAKPATPNAHRVKSQSEMNTSPMRYLASLGSDSADSRAHPNKKTDVWELSVWDPSPLNLRMFCFFSPGHIIVYKLFFPLASLDHHPSVTVFSVIVIQALLSVQMLFLSTRFTQLVKDRAIVQSETMREYDAKFVHPRIHPVVREVSTQTADPKRHVQEEILMGTPTTLIRRSIYSQPRTPDTHNTPTTKGGVLNPQMFTPSNPPRKSEAFASSIQSRPSIPPSASRQSVPLTYTSSTTSTAGLGNTLGHHSDFNGNMSVHNHNKSPLKKTISMNDVGAQEPPQSPRNSREMASYEQLGLGRRDSPFKGSMRPNPFSPVKPSARKQPQERYPSRGYF
ncbi:hypothetical protein N3K66_008034 [Trichothecium roseum]|uniref:Uncharacterized protein n=1 Tax=Trichothecium roseum TaxID=47278 RepID=A0ACC0UU25_9HYPO|nr:hypothetical protein N3K66_008034 [Trichothecium roseum]